ncbi:MAG: hypothetical protein ACYDBJ_12725 [Aggregatilineales bacterium]
METVETRQSILANVYAEIADFLVSGPTPEQIIAFRLSDDSERVISELLEANRSYRLTPAQRKALDDYTPIERLMQAVKVRAFAKLDLAKRDVYLQ